ncbi:MAG: hypothetical protein WA919_13895 [Coleofasciculaceae cyanobacterium]
MSDNSMAFLTGAAVAGVAVLFMIRGGGIGGATNLMPSQPQQISPTNTYDPYNPQGTIAPTPTPVTGFTPNNSLQALELEKLRPMIEQQRTEIEQLKVQMQNQQLLLDHLSARNGTNSPASWGASEGDIIRPDAVEEVQKEENSLFSGSSLLSGVVWALGGVVITMTGGVVVIGTLALLSRQQRPPRTTYVVQQPYSALPQTVSPRRRTEFIQPQYEDRHLDHMDY